jgi:hypothetical protein
MLTRRNGCLRYLWDPSPEARFGTWRRHSEKDTTNGDIYFVASKTITKQDCRIILSGGVRGTNAQLWGLAMLRNGKPGVWSSRICR